MLEKYWHIAYLAKSLKNRPIPVTIFSNHLVIFRNDNNDVAAIEDRCAHRNMPLHCGKVIKGQLQCPYHGWRYDTQGKVTSIPSVPNKERRPKVQITTYPCVEQDGYIWVCLTQKPELSMPPKFPYLNESGWTTFRMQTRFQSTVDNCLENFLDVPHATYVHRLWFRSPSSRTTRVRVSELDDGAIAEYLQEPREKSFVFKLLSRKNSQLKHTDRFLAPSMSRVDYEFSDQKHYIISSFCTPISDTETEVFTVITFKYGFLGKLVRLIFEPLSRIIIQQDVKCLEKQQSNIQCFNGERFLRLPQDVLRPHIESWRKKLRGGVPYHDIKKNVNNSIEIEMNV